MDNLLKDLRVGIRALLKNKGYTAIAVLTLVLGIGANSAIFSIINAVLLSPLPFPESERLVRVRESNPEKGFQNSSLAAGKYTALREHSTVFEEVGAYYIQQLNLTDVQDPEALNTAGVTASLMRALGAMPVVGQIFTEEQDQAGAEPVALLSHSLFERRFGADPGVIGKTIELSRQRYRVVGVMPRVFNFPPRVEVWTPTAFFPGLLADRRARFLGVTARLKPGVTLAQAQEEMNALSARLAAERPETDAGWQVGLVSMREQAVSDVRTGLWILFGAVGLVLAVACVNVANLSLARADSRRKEMAVRAALGASRWRLIRQVLVESLALAVTGGGLGLLLATLGVEALVSASAGRIPRAQEITLDGRVLGFTLLLSVLTGLLFGLMPAWRASQASLGEILKEGSGKLSGSLRLRRLRSALVISEVALALVLLVGAGLLIKSLIRLHQVSPGFTSDGVLTAKLALPWTRLQESANFYQKVIGRVAAVPGVQSVGAINFLPLDVTSTPQSFSIEGRAISDDKLLTGFRNVSGGYFTTLGIPLKQGRLFDERDSNEAPGVLMVNETFAARFFPEEDPVGKRLKIFNRTSFEIVGVVGSVRHEGPDSEPQPEIFYNYLQSAWPTMTLVVRSSQPAAGLAKAIRGELLAIDPAQPVFDIKTMNERLADSVARRRFNMLLLGLFAGVALLLAAVGIYGVISYSVTQRTHEIGVRMAVGARATDVLRMILSEGLKLTLAGVCIGLGAAFGLTRLMGSLLFGVSATDAATFLVVASLLTGVAVAASFIPARRAARVDPMVALRYE
jgi:putative ABC transport system permease protein